MKTSSAKAKGRRLQDWVRDELQYLWQDFLAPSDIRGAIMGERGEDIKLSNVAQKHIGLSIECKNVEKINIWKSYDQAVMNSRPNDEPILIIKKNRFEPLVVVDAKWFFRMHQKARLYENQ